MRADLATPEQAKRRWQIKKPNVDGVRMSLRLVNGFSLSDLVGRRTPDLAGRQRPNLKGYSKQEWLRRSTAKVVISANGRDQIVATALNEKLGCKRNYLLIMLDVKNAFNFLD